MRNLQILSACKCITNGIIWNTDCIKEDHRASPAEIVLGITLSIPGELVTDEDVQPDSEIFSERHGELIRSIYPIPATQHTKTKMSI